MNKRHSSVATRPSKARCMRCGRFKGNIYTTLCEDCVEQTLKQKLPRLRTILEERYGQQLNEWLSNGSFTDVRWEASPDFNIGERLFRRFLSKLIQEATENKDIWLEFTGHSTWTPTYVSQLVNSIYNRCGAELRKLITQQVIEAVPSAPTKQAEKELMALLNEKLRPERMEDLEEAIACVVDSTNSGLPNGARVLLELRSWASRGKSLYTEVSEGKIDEVWKEMEEELPKSIQKLLPEEA